MNTIEPEAEVDYRREQRRKCFMVGKIAPGGVIVWIVGLLRGGVS